MMTPMRGCVGLNVTVLVKAAERYILIYHDDQVVEACRAAAQRPATEGLDFTWYDAAVLARRIRESAERRRIAVAEKRPPQTS
jgi:hypothetical protein